MLILSFVQSFADWCWGLLLNGNTISSWHSIWLQILHFLLTLFYSHWFVGLKIKRIGSFYWSPTLTNSFLVSSKQVPVLFSADICWTSWQSFGFHLKHYYKVKMSEHIFECYIKLSYLLLLLFWSIYDWIDFHRALVLWAWTWNICIAQLF